MYGESYSIRFTRDGRVLSVLDYPVPGMPTASRRALGTRARCLAATAIAVTIGVLAGEIFLTAPADAALRRRCPHANARATRLAKPKLRAAVMCLVNAERAAYGLPALHDSSRLDDTAQQWTDAMVATGDFTHGTDPAARITAVGLSWSTSGENIATGYPTPRRVVSGWMASLDHCRNILNPTYSQVGTGINKHPVRGFASGPATWTEDFALPAGHRPPSHDWGPADSCS
jgi:uncharacterized protein YkwD